MSKNMSIALFLISAQLHIVVELPCHTVYLVLFRNPPSPTTYATPNPLILVYITLSYSAIFLPTLPPAKHPINLIVCLALLLYTPLHLPYLSRLIPCPTPPYPMLPYSN